MQKSGNNYSVFCLTQPGPSEKCEMCKAAGSTGYSQLKQILSSVMSCNYVRSKYSELRTAGFSVFLSFQYLQNRAAFHPSP